MSGDFPRRRAPSTMLTRHRLSSSRKLIYRMIVLTISTGLWTAIISIIDLGFVRRAALAPTSPSLTPRRSCASRRGCSSPRPSSR